MRITNYTPYGSVGKLESSCNHALLPNDEKPLPLVTDRMPAVVPTPPMERLIVGHGNSIHALACSSGIRAMRIDPTYGDHRRRRAAELEETARVPA